MFHVLLELERPLNVMLILSAEDRVRSKALLFWWRIDSPWAEKCELFSFLVQMYVLQRSGHTYFIWTLPGV